MLSAIAGVAIGLAIGWVVAELRKRLDDAPTETAVSLLTPYMAYLPAEALGISRGAGRRQRRPLPRLALAASW